MSDVLAVSLLGVPGDIERPPEQTLSSCPVEKSEGVRAWIETRLYLLNELIELRLNLGALKHTFHATLGKVLEFGFDAFQLRNSVVAHGGFWIIDAA